MHLGLRPNIGRSLTTLKLTHNKDSDLTQEETQLLLDIAEDLAVHVFCNQPQYVSLLEVPEDLLAQWKSEIEEEMRPVLKSKTEMVIGKIIQGKLEKILEQKLLLKQVFGDFEEAVTVQQFLEHQSKKTGFDISVKDFHTVLI